MQLTPCSVMLLGKLFIDRQRRAWSLVKSCTHCASFRQSPSSRQAAARQDGRKKSTAKEGSRRGDHKVVEAIERRLTLQDFDKTLSAA